MIEKLLKNILDDNGKTKIDINEIARNLNGNVELLGDLVDWEIGENASGSYFRHPSGVMICIRKIAFNRTTSEGSGNIYRTPNPFSRDYPAEFIEEPFVDGNLIIPNVGWSTMGAGRTGWNSIRVYSPYNNQIIDDLILIAIGFWK